MINKFIIISDFHLSHRKPPARIEQSEYEWEQSQIKVLKEVLEKAKELNVPIINCGDFFDTKVSGSTYLLNTVRDLLTQYNIPIYSNIGNHDIKPGHNVEEITSSCWYNIFHNLFNKDIQHTVNNLDGFTFIDYPIKYPVENDNEILISHTLTSDENGSAKKYIDEIKQLMPNVKYIFIGDNHKHFIVKHKGITLFSPGCLIKRTLNDKEYKSAYYLYDNGDITTFYTETNIDVLQQHSISYSTDDSTKDFIEILKVEQDVEAINFNEKLKYRRDQSKGIKQVIYNDLINFLENNENCS